jgi:UDP-N-acetylglucosamine diphosphorylase / glucose-1-phosphate thymidylyltransferase / UDP-N-acetylgalactosamine diphosphorylase / glucosamine-1-phosphate N-acetyltransferase / galactosamine-1-phosphate N-acetyltransferase
MRLCLVEDDGASGLEPLTLTRPIHELLLGTTTLADRIFRAFKVRKSPQQRGCVIRSHLMMVQRKRDPNLVVNDRSWLGRGSLLIVNSRWVPPQGFQVPANDRPWVGLCDGKLACALVEPEAAESLEPYGVDSWFQQIAARVRGSELGGEWIARPWDLVARNGTYLERDFVESGGARVSERHLAALALVGPADRLCIHETARIDPYTVFDTTNGPITLGSNVWVQPFTRIEGPCSVGAETQLFRANLRGCVTIGPTCRIGGEVEAAIIQGHSNKYHEGFLGHAYVGEWVNLGAITSNSDLRNDYGEVHVPLQGDPIPTGQAKVGCFIGDHTRTGMGSMLNTGTSIGVMCNVLPAGILLPKHVPSFAAVRYGRVAPGFPLATLFETARTVMGRRGQTFDDSDEQLYLKLYERTRLERERAFHRSNDRRAISSPNSGLVDRPQVAL